MNEFSKEVVTIDGNDYTLFLNRKGIVAWERFTKSETEKFEELREKYKNIRVDKEFESLDDTADPFEGLESIEDFDDDKAFLSKLYQRLYWIMLYTEHKFTISEAKEIYQKGCEEYGEEQIIELGAQMVEEANIDRTSPKEIKNLPALKPKKK